MKQPDPKLHQTISFLKSSVRIIAGGALVMSNLPAAGILFIIAEALGIVEEIV